MKLPDLPYMDAGKHKRLTDRHPMDVAERVIFWPWNFATGRGRKAWPLMLLGFPWVLLLVIPLMGPCLILEVIFEIDRTLTGRK